MRKRNGRRAADVRRAANFGRTSLSDALRYALRQARMTRAAAARALGITARTLLRWIKCETPIVVELILDEPRLCDFFLRCLSVAVRKRALAERREE